jgi:N-carbamoylputrescine amidase
MSRTIKVAALQLSFERGNVAANIERVAALVRQAADRGADAVLPPELFSDHYFCKSQDEANFESASRMEPASGRPRHRRLSRPNSMS